MNNSSCQLDTATYADRLRKCGNAKSVMEGRQIHEEIITRGFRDDPFLGNFLIRMYGSCGCVDEALAVFNNLKSKNVFSWNVMLSVYAQNGHLQQAIEMFDRMPRKSIVSWNAMITAYSLAGRVLKARDLFDAMGERTTISWNAIVVTYAQNGYPSEALFMFKSMELEGFLPNKVSFLAALNACSSSGSLAQARIIHCVVVESGFHTDLMVATTIVSMYGRCGSLSDSVEVFDRLPIRDVVASNAMITAFAQNGEILRARELFDATAKKSIISWNTMIAAYVQAGNLFEARKLFDLMGARNTASWNTLLAGYAQSGNLRAALQLFARMDLEGIQAPDKVTLVTVMDACGSLRDAAACDEIDTAVAASKGIAQDATVGNARVCMLGRCGMIDRARHLFEDSDRDRDDVLWTTMIAAFAQNGLVDEARATFDSMPSEIKNRLAVPWNAMISTYATSGDANAAIALFLQMDLEGVPANDITIVCTVEACSSPAHLAAGRRIHAALDHSLALDLAQHPAVRTALVTMYGRCGKLRDARAIFDAAAVPRRDLVLFSAMIAAYARGGHSRPALELFAAMALDGIPPTGVTFISLLAACSHGGLSSDARYFFWAMAGEYGIAASLDHYVCMVDVLGRAGKVAEAWELVHAMPYEPDAVTWKTLLGCCRVHGKVDMAERAAESLAKVDARNPSSYLLLSNVVGSEIFR